MIGVITKIGKDQMADIEGHHSEVEVSTDRIIGEDHDMLIIIEMILRETILVKCEIIEVNILEVDIEIIIEMTTLKEVEVGLGKVNIQVILEGMPEIVVLGQDKVQEPVLTETESDALNEGNMIILLKTDQICKQEKSQKKYKKCII